MSGTHWAIIGVVVVAFAIYWTKFRHKRNVGLKQTAAGPIVVKKTGKKSWRSKLKSAGFKAALAGGDAFTGGAASKGAALVT